MKFSVSLSVLVAACLFSSCQSMSGRSGQNAAVPVKEKKGVRDCVDKSTVTYYFKGGVKETSVDELNSHIEYQEKTRDLGNGVSQFEKTGTLRDEFYTVSGDKRKKRSVSEYSYDSSGTRVLTELSDGKTGMDTRTVKIMNGLNGYEFFSAKDKPKVKTKVVGIWEQVVYSDDGKTNTIYSYKNSGSGGVEDTEPSTEKYWTEGDVTKSESTTSHVDKDAGGKINFESANSHSCSDREIR